jgi:hypothetical protein
MAMWRSNKEKPDLSDYSELSQSRRRQGAMEALYCCRLQMTWWAGMCAGASRPAPGPTACASAERGRLVGVRSLPCADLPHGPKRSTLRPGCLPLRRPRHAACWPDLLEFARGLGEPPGGSLPVVHVDDKASRVYVELDAQVCSRHAPRALRLTPRQAAATRHGCWAGRLPASDRPPRRQAARQAGRGAYSA